MTIYEKDSIQHCWTIRIQLKKKPGANTPTHMILWLNIIVAHFMEFFFINRGIFRQ